MSTLNVVGRAGKFNIITRQDCLSSHAGLLLVKEFVDRLKVAEVLDAQLNVKQRHRGYTESEAVMALVYNLIVGGDCLTDLEVRRGDPGTRELIGMKEVMAPTTAGEHLRKFHIGAIHDLQRVNRLLQQSVRAEQDEKCCTIDLDSSVYEQASRRKEGSRKAYNGEVGYHPLVAFWDETGEMLMSHLRAGNAYTASKVEWFLDETIRRVPARSEKKLRADSGFYSHGVIAWCERDDVEFGITADQTAPLVEKIEGLSERRWADLERYGVSQVAEVRYQPVGWAKPYRYIVKRDLIEKKNGELCFRHFVFVTNNEKGAAAEVLEWQLKKANLENRIKEHKSGFGLEKLPTGKFHAHWAYLLIGQIAYNVMQWFKRLVLTKEYHESTIKTVRHQIINLAGKIVRTGRRAFLVISEKYKYISVWKEAISNLASLKFA